MAPETGTAGSRSPASAAQTRLPLQHVLAGRYAITGLVRRGAFAEIYQAQDHQAANGGALVWIHLVHPQLVATDGLLAALSEAMTRAAAVTGAGVVPALGCDRDGEYTFAVTAPIAGAPLSELLARKRATGGGGLGARGAANVIGAVCAALAAAHQAGVAHGAVSTDSVYASPEGAIALADLGLGALIPAAVRAGMMQAPATLAPEDAREGVARPAGDVFSVGHLLYTSLVGAPLVKGGRRPSEFGVPAAVDELVARCVAAQPDNRPADAAALANLLGRALSATPTRPRVSTPPAGQPSLAQSLSPTAGPPSPSAVPGAPTAVAVAAGDDEKWLVSKGRMDYGPYTMASVIEQIQSSEIVAGNRIVDKDTGERWHVEDHPQLAALIAEAARRREELRRAGAEEQHVKQEKRRGLVLYSVIAAVVLGLGGLTYALVTGSDKSDEEQRAGLKAVSEGALAVKISEPVQSKTPRRSSRSRGGSRGGGDDAVFDLSKEGGDERLDNATINQVIQRHGSKLGACLLKHKNESTSAAIAFVIGGSTGRVSSVKVNGGTSGGLYSCINRAMRSMQFPTVDGPRTRAEFDISL